MRPDDRLRAREAESAIEDAFRAYPEPRDVLLYVAHRETDVSWNELQRRAGLTPSDLSDRILQVEKHLRERMQEHLA
jgi:hypothetical protein